MSFKAIIIIGGILFIFISSLWDGYNRFEGLPLFTVLALVVAGFGWFLGFGWSVLMSCFQS